ncbi:MAG: LCP family protein [Christensenellales bacterium]|jgi:LCP family protein required for cell wall assembly
MSMNMRDRRSSSQRPSASSRRRRKKQATGRFYAFVALVAVVILAAIFVPKMLRSRGADNPPAAQNEVQNRVPDDTAPDDSSEIKSISDLIESDDELAPLEGSQKVQTSADLSVNTSLPSTWHNILLLGTDSRNKNKVSRTDTMMIASINEKDGRIKLISIMRDMIVDIPGHGQNKMNACVYFGGPELLMQVLNEKLHMNITEYAMVNFYSFQHVIDAIGGIELDITQEEMERLNTVLGENAKASGMAQEDWKRAEAELKTFGANTHLNGMQALGYARIRHIDSDYQRTKRQRDVLNAVLKKAKTMNLTVKDILGLAQDVYGYIDTNIPINSAITLASSVLSNGVGEIEQARMPAKNTAKSETRGGKAALWDVDYEANARVLYTYIYES